MGLVRKYFERRYEQMSPEVSGLLGFGSGFASGVSDPGDSHASAVPGATQHQDVARFLAG